MVERMQGYRTSLAVFPDLKMGITVFSNLGDVNAGRKLYQVADLFIPDTTKHKLADESENIDSGKAVLKDTGAIKKFAGNYIADDGLQIHFRLNNKKLFADAFGRTFLLIKATKDSFALISDPGVKFSV
jgi:hypothetical protein